MRRAFAAALTALLVVLAVPAAPVFAASNAKVVVIVGPVGDHTAHYKSDANDVVAEAKKYTTNVIKVVTPNATWTKVKAAAQGASILVYLGHGNGWPSPYAPFQTNTKDGLGLDPSTGADSTRTVYYGEGYIRANIRLAPNAVVLLFHLCYASGNTEPGMATGTYADSRLRVDNYGAGFIGAGARAVFAEGHPEHPVASYIRQLFNSNRTMDQVFRAAPTYHGHVVGPFASQRTPGLAFEMDPDTSAPSGFYRSLVGDLALTASAVTRSTLESTGTHPADFVVPGAAEVTDRAGAGLFSTAEAAADPAATAPSTLDPATRLRIGAEAAPAADGTRILEISVLGGSTTGFVRATSVRPRDSAATVAWTADASPAMLSPNGDGTNDELVITTRFSESIASTFVVKNAAGTTVKSLALTNDLARYEWNLLDGSGNAMPDGPYTWALKGKDTWGNTGLTRTGSFSVDSVAPASKGVAAGTAGGGGWLVSAATTTITAKDATSGIWYIVWRVDGASSKTYTAPVAYAGNGTHTFEYRAVDKAGNKEAWRQLTLKIDTRAPAIALPLTGTAGDVAGLWRGAVTITPGITDATSGVGPKTVAVDDAAPVALGSTPLVVKGDGSHTVTVTATDVAGNTGSSAVTFTIDTTAPVIELPEAGGTIPSVSPNGDGTGETLAVPYSIDEAATVTATVTDEAGTTVRTITTRTAAGAAMATWDGRTAAGVAVPDGRYTVTLRGRDGAGNTSEPVTTAVDVYGALSTVTRSVSLFFPQDADTLAPQTTIGYTLLAPATVTVHVLDAGGSVVRTAMTDAPLLAGPQTWAWDGRRDDGTFAPRGTYRVVVDATNGSQAGSLVTAVRADAFRLTTSTTTAIRGKAVTITAVTAERLSTTPVVVVRQPGLTARKVTMTKVSATRWTATVTPSKTGAAGTLSLTVKATDIKGGANSSVVKLALQ